MKILVTGASGLLGLNLSLQMHDKHEIIGVDRAKLANTPFNIIKADLLNLDALPKLSMNPSQMPSSTAPQTPLWTLVS